MHVAISSSSSGVDIQYLTYAGLLAIRLTGPAMDSATVLLHGGQLVSWVNVQGHELLQAGPLDSSPQRTGHAGAPLLVFPDQPDGDAHDVQTERLDRPVWRLHDAWFHQGVPHLRLRLASGETARSSWRQEFDCYLHMLLDSPDLQLTLYVVNTSTHARHFKATLQPCLRLETAVACAAAGASSGAGQAPLRVPSAGGWVDVLQSTPPQLVQLAPGAQWQASQQMRWTPAEV